MKPGSSTPQTIWQSVSTLLSPTKKQTLKVGDYVEVTDGPKHYAFGEYHKNAYIGWKGKITHIRTDGIHVEADNGSCLVCPILPSSSGSLKFKILAQ